MDENIDKITTSELITEISKRRLGWDEKEILLELSEHECEKEDDSLPDNAIIINGQIIFQKDVLTLFEVNKIEEFIQTLITIL
jgi:hypothetical protein